MTELYDFLPKSSKDENDVGVDVLALGNPGTLFANMFWNSFKTNINSGNVPDLIV